MHRSFLAAVLVAATPFFFALAASAQTPAARVETGSFSLLFENDLFFDSDRDYSNGVAFAYTAAPGDVPDWQISIARALPFLSSDGEVRTTYAIGQEIFTPRKTQLAVPDPTERPYAGFLYGSIGFLSKTDHRLDQWQITLGMTGPSSLAADSQNFVHSVIGENTTKGWHYQLRGEPGVIITYDRSYKLIPPASIAGLFIDVVPHAGVTVGNIYDYVNAGLMMRLGFNLPDDYGPLRMDPSLPGTNFFEPNGAFSAYVFAGVDGRAIARNLFLDGNSFAPSASVEKRALVADLQLGAAIAFETWRLAFTHVLRTKEYATQKTDARFGAVSITHRF